MRKKRRKRKTPKRVLRLPDLALAKTAVLNTLTSESAQRSYDHAITEFVDWYAFYRATEELPSKIEGLDRVWVGKLRKRPAVSQQVKLGREYGACMELDDEAALETYAVHPAQFDLL